MKFPIDFGVKKPTVKVKVKVIGEDSVRLPTNLFPESGQVALDSFCSCLL